MKQETRRGQATVEFAIVFLLVIIVLFGTIETARAIFEKHSLFRAAEVIAQDLADYQVPGTIDFTRANAAVQDGARQANLGLDLSSVTWQQQDSPGPLGNYHPADRTCTGVYPNAGSPSSTPADGTTCMSFNYPDVTIIGTSSLDAPCTIIVTVSQPYNTFIGFSIPFFGGRASETVAATTLEGQQDQQTCPAE